MTASLVADTGEITSVDEGRVLMDAIDGHLLALLMQRRELSTRIQQLRVDAGGSRVEHSRENAILRRYSEALGDGGVELALSVLEHCRGRQAPGRP
jgi:chorismate mutase